MTDDKRPRSTLGDRMADVYFVVKGPDGKPKGVISSSEEKPDKGSDSKS